MMYHTNPNSLRLYYGKYPYKVCLDAYQNDTGLRVMRFKAAHKDKELKTRAEGYSISVFAKDEDFLNTILDEFKGRIRVVYRPDENALKSLTTGRKTEIRKKLTHGCRYRVHLVNNLNRLKMDFTPFLNTYNRNPTQFHISRNLLSYFKEDYRYWYGIPYFHVRDEKFLSLAQLVLGPAIKEIVTIITPSEVEEKSQCHLI